MTKMTYTKEKDGNGLRYVDMCIYIDNTMKDWDLEHPLTQEQEETIYKYIYLLYYALTCKKHYFNTVAEYDSYSLYCAARLYIRLTDPMQFEHDENGEPLVTRIKSVLNYIKATMFGYRASWRAENVPSNISAAYSSYDPVAFENSLRDIADSKNKEKVVDEILNDIEFIPRNLKAIIEENNYHYSVLTKKKLYLSALLTFSSRINSETQLKNILKYYSISEPAILWHLDKKMESEVNKILNQLREKMKDDISYTTAKYMVPLEDIKNSLWESKDALGVFDE